MSQNGLKSKPKISDDSNMRVEEHVMFLETPTTDREQES